jgi:NAD(P)-dependent dehydrogenase (short-subunit alcohol dehydrogenase family)
LLVGAAAALMTERGWGRIISISSVSGQRGSASLALYGATKPTLEQLTRAWAAEFGPRDVAVNFVAPGRELTPFSEKKIGADSLYSPSCLVEVPSDVRREKLRKIARLADALGRIRGHHTCGEKGYR